MILSLLFSENKTIWLSLIVSLTFHGLLFVFSGKTFIQRAQLSVQPSAQMVEVSIEEAKDTTQKEEDLKLNSDISAPKNILNQNHIEHKLDSQSRSGVSVKANPDYFQNPSPQYPELAKQMRQEGLVMLAVDVGLEGNPITVEIKQSSGFRLLDQAALKTVSHWKFKPGSLGNIPIETTVTVPIRFKLIK